MTLDAKRGADRSSGSLPGGLVRGLVSIGLLTLVIAAPAGSPAMPRIGEVNGAPAFQACVSAYYDQCVAIFGLSKCKAPEAGGENEKLSDCCRGAHDFCRAGCATDACRTKCFEAVGFCFDGKAVAAGDEPPPPGYYDEPDHWLGERLDWCYHRGADCGAPAAHAFCENELGTGFAAQSFAQATDLGASGITTIILGEFVIEQAVCSEPYCDGFEYIQCVDTRATHANPTWQGYPLDFCRTYSGDCGQPAADAYCRATEGDDHHASSWVRADDVGPTRIIATGEICTGTWCDGFASITCAYDPYLSDVSDDLDSDGVTDAADNCLAQPNPFQENWDGDPLGDECDPLPDQATLCSNGLDDDGDGLSDWDDPGCADLTDDDEHSPALACDDGLDDDGDGLVDLEDPGCSSLSDGSEHSTDVCDDGVDNDGDGDADYPADPDCSDPTDEDERGVGACNDGLDNDGNGLADWDPTAGAGDPGCTGPDDPFELEVRPGDLLVALRTSDQIVRVDPVTGAQTIVLDGVIEDPTGLAFESSRRLVVTSLETDRVWRFDLGTGVVSLLSDGVIDGPFGVGVEPGGSIFVGQWFAQPGDVFRIDPVSGEATVFKQDAGRVTGLAVTNGQLHAVARDTGKLFRWSTTDGSTAVGSPLPGGTATGPRDVAVAANGDLVYTENEGTAAQTVRRRNPTTGADILVTSGGQLVSARGVAIESDGSIVVSDESSQALIRIDATTGAQRTPPVSSGGLLANAPYRFAIAPRTQCSDGIDQDGDGLTDLLDPDCRESLDDAEWHLEAGDLVLTDSSWLDGSGALLRVDAAGTHVTTLYGGSPLVTPYAAGLGRDGEIWFTDVGTNSLLRLDADDGRLSLVSTDPLIANPRSLAVDRSGDVFIGTQTVHGILRVRTVTGHGEVEFVTQKNAIFDYPVDLQLSSDGTKLYLLDRTNVQDIVIETDLSNPGQHSVNSRTIVDFGGLASNPQPRGLGLTSTGDLLAVESETDQLYEIGLPIETSAIGPGPGLLTGGVLGAPVDVVEEPDGDRVLIDPLLHALYRVPTGSSEPSLFFTAPEIDNPILLVRVPEACSNGFDDDGDGMVDFPEDPECLSAMQPIELPEPGSLSGLAAGILGLLVLARRRTR